MGSDVRSAPAAQRWVSLTEADSAWDRVVEGYRSKFSSEFREAPDKLRRNVDDLLEAYDLAHVDGDRLRVHAALARYRPDAGVGSPTDSVVAEAPSTSRMFGDDDP